MGRGVLIELCPEHHGNEKKKMPGRAPRNSPSILEGRFKVHLEQRLGGKVENTWQRRARVAERKASPSECCCCGLRRRWVCSKEGRALRIPHQNCSWEHSLKVSMETLATEGQV